jgi:hypothetical protein
MPFTLYLQQNDQQVDGSASSSMGDAPISSGSFKQNTLEIQIETPDSVYNLTAKLDGRKLSGTWTYGKDDKGTWEGEKTWPAGK